MVKVDLKFPMAGSLRYEQNGKRIVAYRTYRGNVEFFCVSYYSDEYDIKHRTKFLCCQKTTTARTEAGALKMINRFFNE